MIKKIVLGALVTTLSCAAEAVTLVYNLRIRRAFDTPANFQSQKKAQLLFSAVPIVFARKSTIDELVGQEVHEKRRVHSVLFNARYVPSRKAWLELTTGVGKDKITATGTDSLCASRTGLDDIVLSGGYRSFVSDKAQLVGYGLLGFPATSKICPLDKYGPLMGSRLYSMGCGLEFSYSLLNSPVRSCSMIGQTRFIHSFNRQWFPILPQDAQLAPGNTTDIFWALQFREKKMIFEAGYDATIFSQQAVILSTHTVKGRNAVRHSGYVSVSYAIPEGYGGKPWILGAGLNGSSSKEFDSQTISAWLSCSVVF